jgi:hypothetical protein
MPPDNCPECPNYREHESIDYTDRDHITGYVLRLESGKPISVHSTYIEAYKALSSSGLAYKSNAFITCTKIK